MDLVASVEQSFNCFIIQNRRAVQFKGRLMDWTFEDNLAERLCFRATFTGRWGVHTSPVQARAEMSDISAEAVKPKLSGSRKGHSRRMGADVGDESTETRSDTFH